MEIAPEKVKTEPPEDEVASEEPEIEVGEVKYESGQAPTPQDPLACDEVTVKEEPMLTVEHGMLPANDAVVLSDAIISIPPVTIKEEPQDLEESDPCADPVDFAFVEETKIKSEPADTENKEAEPGPSTSSGAGNFVCLSCGVAHQDEISLSQHVQHHMATTDIGTSTLSCSLCDFKCQKRRHLTLHIRVKHSETKLRACSLCKFTSNYRSSIRSHFLRAHTEKKFECPQCEYTSRCKAYLKDHIQCMHSGKKLHSCSICNASYSWYGSLAQHEKRKHEGEIYFHCKTCDFIATSRNDLRLHTTYIHGGSYECYHCMYKSNDRRYLKKHIHSFHLGEVHCPHCHAKFSAHSYMKKHIQSFHVGKKRMTFFTMDQL